MEGIQGVLCTVTMLCALYKNSRICVSLQKFRERESIEMLVDILAVRFTCLIPNDTEFAFFFSIFAVLKGHTQLSNDRAATFRVTFQFPEFTGWRNQPFGFPFDN